MKNNKRNMNTLTDLGGEGCVAPSQSNFFFIFMQFSAKIMPKNRLVTPPLGLAHPLENPGSTTGMMILRSN